MSKFIERVTALPKGDVKSQKIVDFMSSLVSTGYDQGQITNWNKEFQSMYKTFEPYAERALEGASLDSKNTVLATIDMTLAANAHRSDYKKMIERFNRDIEKTFGKDVKKLDYTELNERMNGEVERAFDLTDACVCYTLTDLVVDLVCSDDTILNYLLRVPTECKDAKFTKLTKTFITDYQAIGADGVNISSNLKEQCETIPLKQLFYFIDISRADILCSCVLDRVLEGVKFLRQNMINSKIIDGVFYGDGTGNNPIGMNVVATPVTPGVDLIDTVVKMITRLSSIDGSSNNEIIIALNKAAATSIGLSRDANGNFLLPDQCNPKLACATFVETCIPSTGVGTPTLTTDIFGFIRNHYAYADGTVENYSVENRLGGKNAVEYGVIQYFYSQPVNDDSIVKSTVSINV